MAERLLQHNGHEDADANSSALPPGEPAATERHIHGMECTGVADAAARRAAAAAKVRSMLQLTAASGGRASALMAHLEGAHAYLARPVAEASRASDDDWRGYQRIVAADLPKVDWSVSGGGPPREEARARQDLARRMAASAVEVGEICAGARRAWQRAAAPAVARRQEGEQRREQLRVILRAWRERCDSARVRPAGHGVLAARMARGPHARGGCGVERLWQLGWSAKVLVEWMRLVRGTRGRLRDSRPPRGDRRPVGQPRRTDAVLSLRGSARALLSRHLGGGGTRLAHAQRARGDG